jgi:HK97 family phage portal protein
MGLLWRGRERRYNGFTASFANPPIPPNSATGSGSYQDISLAHAETSLQTVAMWSAVDLITSLTSELPIDVHRGSGASKTELSTPSYLEDPAGDGYGVEDWIAKFLWSCLLRGNATGKVLEWSRSTAGAFPTQIDLYHPDVVSGWYGPDGMPEWRVAGRAVEDLSTLWHRRVYPVPGRLMGLSPVAQQASTLGLTLAATQFGYQWFTDGAHPSGVLMSKDRTLSETQATTAKDRFMAALRGRREPAVLDSGWDYKQVQINPEESQFLETNKFSQAQVARIFGPGMAEVLGYESGGSLTYSTVEGRSQHLLVYAMNKWLRRVDRALSGMLPRGQRARLNRSALLEPTVLDRWRVYQLQLATKARTINEVRADEDWESVEWGDEPVAGDPIPPDTVPATDPNGPAGASQGAAK